MNLLHIRPSLPLAGMVLMVAAILFLLGCNPSSREAPVAVGQTGDSSVVDATEEIALSPGHRQMVSHLAEIARRTPDEHRYIGDAQARQLQAMLETLPPEAPTLERAKLLYMLADAELKLGQERLAIKHFELAKGHFESSKHSLPADQARGMAIEIDFSLGVAYLRLGETQNCCQRNTADSCILPIQGSGVHVNREGSTRAAECFHRALQATPPELPDYHRARWLFNIAHMTLGSYPEGVPAKYLLAPEKFESDESFPRFNNISSKLGLDTFSLAGGVVADDFDNDGYLDLAVSTWDTSGQLRYFHNEGDGSFIERTKEAGLEGIFGGLNLVQADYDNDGVLDILVLRGAWLAEYGNHANSLLRGSIGPRGVRFADVTFEAGLGEKHYPTQTGSWADYDNDGDLDLYVGNETPPSGSRTAPCQLFQNNGDRTFTDVAVAAGVTNDRFAKAALWGDYDGDNFPDIYVSNMRGENRLYRNNRDGTFTDVAPRLGVTGPRESFPAWFWDYDNDGHLDLYVSAYGAAIAEIAATHADAKLPPIETASLYRNDGQGSLVDVAVAARLNRHCAPMGANFGDLDGDGFLDFYLGTGYTAIFQLMPNMMYRNHQGKWFADVTTAGGFGHLQKGHGVAIADFDNDGDQDVFEQMGGAYLGDKFFDALYENPGFQNRWITLRLVGVQTNRSAIGARIRVDVIEEDELGESRQRSIYKHVNSGGTFGANPLRQTIGLGQATRIEKIEVNWPRTGKTQVVTDVTVNQTYEIVEGELLPRRTPLKSFRLEGRQTE